jgi:hypothetical protein
MSSWPPTIGQLLPRVQNAHGVESKLRAYSLNMQHEIGAHKARVFQRALGIGLDDVEHLVDQLLVGIGDTPISDVRDNAPYGVLCEVVVSVQGIGVAAGRLSRSRLPGSIARPRTCHALCPRISSRRLAPWL